MLPHSANDDITFLLLRHILFVLVVMGCFCLLLGFSCSAAHAATPEAQYTALKEGMERLKTDARRSVWREPWQTLAQGFDALVAKHARWNNVAAAAFRAAQCHEELARRSFVNVDRRRAAQRYLRVADSYPRSVLADDALLAAAQLYAGPLNDTAAARALLERVERDYPHGDMLAGARALRARCGMPEGETASAAVVHAPAEEAKRAAPAGAKKAVPAREITQKKPARRTAKAEAGTASARVSTRQPADAAATAASGNPAAQASAAAAREGTDILTARTSQTPEADASPASENHAKTTAASAPAAETGTDTGDTACTATAPARTAEPAAAAPVAAEAGTAPVRKAQTPAADAAQAPTRTAQASAADAGKAARRPAAAGAGRPFRPVSQEALAGMGAQLGLQVQTVFIDAGHGGSDPGAVHNDVREERVTLDIARQLGEILEAAGLQVLYSRTVNRGLSLAERTALANAGGADIFISLHVNACDDRKASGLETYFLDLARDQRAVQVAMRENANSGRGLGEMNRLMARVMVRARTLESRSLATDIQRQTAQYVRSGGYTLRSGNSRSAPFWVLMDAAMPSVLIEVGYSTNAAEAARLAQPAYRRRLAEGVALGIVRYKNRMESSTRAALNLTGGGAGAM